MSAHKDNVIQFKPRKNGVTFAVILTILGIGLIILFTCFHIDKIEVTGNHYYTDKQIKEFVLDNGYIDNSILLMLKNKIHSKKDIPFIAKLDVEYVNPHKISVTVYEKAMAGCVEYMNQYVYFDQDGYVLEVSVEKLETIPCITGMSFESMELHEKLPIEDKKRFKTILKLTQLIEKYHLIVDAIKFTSEAEIVMECGDIRIELGDGSNLEEQLIDLAQMLQGLEGRKGTLNLKDFDADSGKASFKETIE